MQNTLGKCMVDIYCIFSWPLYWLIKKGNLQGYGLHINNKYTISIRSHISYLGRAIIIKDFLKRLKLRNALFFVGTQKLVQSVFHISMLYNIIIRPAQDYKTEYTLLNNISLDKMAKRRNPSRKEDSVHEFRSDNSFYIIFIK